jgi:hypothetical protein
MAIFRGINLRMKNISDTVIEKIKTHILCSIIPHPGNCTVYEIMLPEGTQKAIKYGACA